MKVFDVQLFLAAIINHLIVVNVLVLYLWVKMDKELLSIKKIEKITFEKEIELVEIRTKIKLYKGGRDKYAEETNKLKEEIQEVEEEIDRMKGVNELLEQVYQNELKSLPLSQKSSVIHRLYEKSQIKFYDDQLAEQQDKLRQFQQQYDEKMEMLKNRSELYKTIQKFAAELKMSKFTIADLKQKAQECKKIQHDLLQMKKRLFYNDMIQVSRVAVDIKKLDDQKVELELETAKRKQMFQNLLDAEGTVKTMQKAKHSSDSLSKMMINKEKKEDTKSNTVTEKTNMEPPLSKGLQMLKKSMMYTPMKFQPPKVPNSMVQYNTDATKVKILDNKLVKLPERKSSQENAKRILKVSHNLDKMYRNYQKKISRQNSTQNSREGTPNHSQRISSQNKEINKPRPTLDTSGECLIINSQPQDVNRQDEVLSESVSMDMTPSNSHKLKKSVHFKLDKTSVINPKSHISEEKNSIGADKGTFLKPQAFIKENMGSSFMGGNKESMGQSFMGGNNFSPFFNSEKFQNVEKSATAADKPKEFGHTQASSEASHFSKDKFQFGLPASQFSQMMYTTEDELDTSFNFNDSGPTEKTPFSLDSNAFGSGFGNWFN